ncbi:unnamed protein product [Fusarium graminearum]|uniref:Uncharacterized protein n=1 Tax=Gibberella zeae TaxID=5518 RepID=A0A4U9ETS5_GIBZA|nr:hypothetical protein HG531_004973 [Fusarium graminearum]CAF3453775.1 unnamed protein product [Fusarium graminearum]CAF3493901.1 unnamed protein product [Fusarium graminearum]CAG1964926.1 unnamed protein product [Fusarium graminearum]CAG1966455.1 unnamed protein product [Fusarium graminearum]
MRGATRRRPDHSFSCVVADQHPEFCDKTFPTIEKHKLVNSIGYCIAEGTDNSISEHLKRCHSLFYWCEKCLHKFNTSLPKGNLELDKAKHNKNECKGEPSSDSLQTWSGHWIMDQDQYHRFKVVGWQHTHVPNPIFINGKKEPKPMRSWRRIRETIFPGSSIELNAEPVAPGRTTQDVITMVGGRPSVMPQVPDVLTHGTDLSERLMPIPPSMTTDVSQLSTEFSWETSFQTDPSSLVLSYLGADEPHEPYDIQHESITDHEDPFGLDPEEYQRQQSWNSLSGAGCWQTPLPYQVLLEGNSSDPQEAAGRE